MSYNGYSEEYAVAMAMKTHGGHFVRALGEALIHADSRNTQKIKDTWPEYWNNYLTNFVPNMDMFKERDR